MTLEVERYWATLNTQGDPCLKCGAVLPLYTLGHVVAAIPNCVLTGHPSTDPHPLEERYVEPPSGAFFSGHARYCPNHNDSDNHKVPSLSLCPADAFQDGLA